MISKWIYWACFAIPASFWVWCIRWPRRIRLDASVTLVRGVYHFECLELHLAVSTRLSNLLSRDSLMEPAMRFLIACQRRLLLYRNGVFAVAPVYQWRDKYWVLRSLQDVRGFSVVQCLDKVQLLNFQSSYYWAELCSGHLHLVPNNCQCEMSDRVVKA